MKSGVKIFVHSEGFRNARPEEFLELMAGIGFPTALRWVGKKHDDAPYFVVEMSDELEADAACLEVGAYQFKGCDIRANLKEARRPDLIPVQHQNFRTWIGSIEPESTQQEISDWLNELGFPTVQPCRVGLIYKGHHRERYIFVHFESEAESNRLADLPGGITRFHGITVRFGRNRRKES